MIDLSFWKGKRVFLTGHTGFKGSWLSRILSAAGAVVTGYSLPPPDVTNLYSICGLTDSINSIFADIRDGKRLLTAFSNSGADIVIHMAAQPLVGDSYQRPQYTYEVNVMGTVNILECIRLAGGVKSFLNVTTDKVYHNNEWEWGYRESDPLDGYDPYSNSKSCSELITHSYKNSFFENHETAISTARAGNVIGGGDFSIDRIVPDCFRAAMREEPIIIRNPLSVRPYQHVLEPLFAYLMILQKQYEDAGYAGYFNIGPDEHDCITTGELATLFCEYWGRGLTWENHSVDGPHEANFLKLDCSRIKKQFNWKPHWTIHQAIKASIEWTLEYMGNGDIPGIMDKQIQSYRVTD